MKVIGLHAESHVHPGGAGFSEKLIQNPFSLLYIKEAEITPCPLKDSDFQLAPQPDHKCKQYHKYR